MTLAAELFALERGFWCASGDRDAYAQHLAPDALHVFPGWGIAPRDRVLQGVAESAPWTSFEFVDPRIVRLGDGAAALCYRVEATRGTEDPYHAAIISVYRRDDGEWRLAVHQQTALPS